MTRSSICHTNERSAGSLWTFSLRVYSQPGVPQACLGLQDDLELDVNIVLLAMYAGASKLELASSDFVALDLYVAAWRSESVWPLRATRRNIKRHLSSSDNATGDLADATYQAVKAAELAAEHAQQLLMERWLSAQPTSDAGVRCLRQNLDAYFQAKGVERDACTDARCQVIETAADALVSVSGA